MESKSTDEMKTELMCAPDLSGFLSDNSANFSSCGVPELLSDMLKQKGITKAALAKGAGMSEVYLYQVLAGRRRPSRNRLLCMCFGLSATIGETQKLLTQSGYAELYVKKRGDAVIAFALLHGKDLAWTNDRLFAEGEETLC